MKFRLLSYIVSFLILYFSTLVNLELKAQVPRSKQLSNNNLLPQQTKDKLDEIYTKNKYSPKPFRAVWLPDSKAYLRKETDEKNGHTLLVKYKVEDGKRLVLYSTGQSTKSSDKGVYKMIEGVQVSDNGSEVLLQINRKEKEVSSTEYLMLDIVTGKTRAVVGGEQNWLSPDGKKNVFSQNGNLFLYDIQTDTVIILTNKTAGREIFDGQVIWSPDGKKISFIRTDQSRVRIRQSLLPADPTYPKISETRYARIGGAIPELQLGVLDIEYRTINWVPLEVSFDGFYIGQISWTGSDELIVEKFNRFRTHRAFLLFNIQNKSLTPIFEESDPDWVVASYNKNGGFISLQGSNRYLFVSEKDGWRHAYVGSLNNLKTLLPLTRGNFDIIDKLAVDVDSQWLYFHASPENGTQKYLYRISLDGKGKQEKLTPAHQNGTHDYIFSPDAKWAFHTYSNSQTAPVTELIRFPGHKAVRVLEANHHLKEKEEEARLQPKEFVKIDIGDNIVMDAWIIKPRKFNSSKKYPLFVYVYGEPHAQTVLDEWENAYAAFHRTIADLGYIVVSIDNRGTPSPKGAAWRRAVSGSLGPLSTEEQAKGVIELGRKYSYIDLERVGIWGWSGGGSNTLNALFRRSDVYSLGIAVAPKPQPWLYNAWFQEIYMKTPEVNPLGYSKSAPINFAEGLKGDLLIIHGTGETNTHIQITEGLVDRLIELGKSFDYMTYPDRDHGIREKAGTTLHLRTLIVRYLLQHLQAGPKNQ